MKLKVHVYKLNATIMLYVYKQTLPYTDVNVHVDIWESYVKLKSIIVKCHRVSMAIVFEKLAHICVIVLKDILVSVEKYY